MLKHCSLPQITFPICSGFKRSGHSFKEAKAERKAEAEILGFHPAEAEAEAEVENQPSEAVNKAVFRFASASQAA